MHAVAAMHADEALVVGVPVEEAVDRLYEVFYEQLAFDEASARRRQLAILDAQRLHLARLVVALRVCRVYDESAVHLIEDQLKVPLAKKKSAQNAAYVSRKIGHCETIVAHIVTRQLVAQRRLEREKSCLRDHFADGRILDVAEISTRSPPAIERRSGGGGDEKICERAGLNKNACRLAALASAIRARTSIVACIAVTIIANLAHKH